MRLGLILGAPLLLITAAAPADAELVFFQSGRGAVATSIATKA
jgi:hypothetical protein